MSNPIVKQFIYKQLIVICAFLIAGCSQPNRFSEDHLRHVHTFADERKTDAVLGYFNHYDEEVREQACMLAGALNDSTVIAPLLKSIEFDASEKVRAAAAFSLGQMQMDGIVNLAMRLLLIEKNEEVKAAILIAIGKSGGGNALLEKRKEIDEDLNPALAEALFYSIRKSPTDTLLLPLFIELIEEEDDTRFYALSAIARMKGNSSSAHPALKKLLEEEDNEDTRPVLLRAFCSSGEADSAQVNSLFASEENYLCRLALLRGTTTWKTSASKTIMKKALADKNFHIRETASEMLLAHDDWFSAETMEKIALAENHPRTRYILYQAALKHFSGKEALRISSAIRVAYSKENDEYVKGCMLKALSSDFTNLAFLEEECFNTESILIREFCFEAILLIRSDVRFPSYASQWNASGATQSLEEHFIKVIRDAISTYDVSLVAMASGILRDTTLPGSSKTLLPIPSDTRFVEDAMQQMRLPRDIESYGELLKTMRFLEGKPVEGNLKPDFNNPIEWDLVARIPKDQQIEIVTDAGTIVCELWVNDAPGTVAQFVKLIQNGFYANKRLHRVVPGFVIQDGCPRGDGYGSTMETIRSEFTRKKFDAGVLGMASAGPDTESCQWFITHTRTPHLNGRYTAFGRVKKGMEIVHLLGYGAHIQNIVLAAP